MSRLALACILLPVALAAQDPAPSATYTSAEYGFTLNPPAQTGAEPPCMVASFFAPASDQFAPNVGVVVQPYADPIANYGRLLLAQFTQNHLTVVATHVTGDAFTSEYRGQQQGRTLHWYAKAVKRQDRVYLITATALDTQWAAAGPALITAVESFRFTGQPVVAAPVADPVP